MQPLAWAQPWEGFSKRQSGSWELLSGGDAMSAFQVQEPVLRVGPGGGATKAPGEDRVLTPLSYQGPPPFTALPQAAPQLPAPSAASYQP